MGEETFVHKATNQDPNPGPPGTPPYEMKDRKERRGPLVTWQDVSGWRVEGKNAEGWLYRSEEQKLFRKTCGKLVYVSRGEHPELTLTPPQPLRLQDPWESVNFWNYGNNWGWAPDPETPPLHVSVILSDDREKEFEIPLGRMNYTYWFLMNGRLHQEEQETLKRPVYLVGFRFTGGTNKEKRTVYLGPCSFFQEKLEPLAFKPWPQKLPFPTREETILPSNGTARFENKITRKGKETIFLYQGDDATLTFVYSPDTGLLDDLDLIYNDQRLKPLAGGGPFLEDGLSVDRKLKGLHRKGDALEARWRFRSKKNETAILYRFRLVQKSMIIEMEAENPVVSRVSLGRAEGVRSTQLFKIPYLTYGGNDPHLLLSGDLFLFEQFDWYVSEASALTGGKGKGTDWAVFNGGAEYEEKTNGHRNLMKERLFLTASPKVWDVLPNIPNPASPMKEKQGHRLWRVKHGADYRAEIEEASRFRRYGCEHVSIRYHENTWRDAGESFTFRLHAAPGQGGDEALKRVVSDVQALGWRVGLYTNYTDFAPVNSYWDEDWVNRLPNGDWQRAWMRCYAPKPMRAVEMEAQLAPQIQAKFGENHSYCDVHTAVTPFSRVDYDHRVPGAGTFRRTFECFGRLLYNEKFAHKGPVYSEGHNHWWYAGLTDGNYAQLVSSSPPEEPLFVDFDLLKLHPLQMDSGMGAPGMFFKGAKHNLDQFIATTLAYGHIGFLDWTTFAGALKIYYLLQPIQSCYTLIPVDKIEYEDGERFLSTSEALASGAHKKGRVHVVYGNGAEVYVNGDKEPWQVASVAGQFELPTWGHLAFHRESGVLCYSAKALRKGRDGKETFEDRVDFSQGPESLYMDSRGKEVDLGRFAGCGAVALKKEKDGWRIIPAMSFEKLRIPLETLSLDGGLPLSVEVLDENDVVVATARSEIRQGTLQVWPFERSNVIYRLPSSPLPSAG